MTLDEFKKFCLDNFVGHFDSDDQPEQLSLFEQEEIGGCGCFVGDMEEKEKT